MSNSETRVCQNCGRKFIIEPEDFEFYKKIGVPAPTLCPDCRLQRRLAFKNIHNLYKRKCDLCGKDIISMYSKDVPSPVYCRECWWSDKWDAMEYGRDYDFNRPFFEQLKDLANKVPMIGLLSDHRSINSEYTHFSGPVKNCYLVFHGEDCENCFYSTGILHSRDCLDNLMIQNCELSYQAINCKKCYRVLFSVDCEESQNLFFCKNCINCSDCFGCVNLRHKQYYIFNQPYSKEEYFKKLKEFNLGSYKSLTKLKEKVKKFWLKFPVKYMHGQHNSNVSGDYIYYSKNVFSSYEVVGAKNCKYSQFLITKPSNDCYDYTGWGDNAELIYDSFNVGEGLSQVKFSIHTFNNCKDLSYCHSCSSSHHLFGCIGLRHKQYCILNKQYTKEEYEKLVPKIIEQMNKLPYKDKKGRVYKYGEFFPIELSPFAYNETVAQEYFPLTKEEAINQGYSWYDRPKSEYQPTIKAEDLPDHIKDVDDSITQEVIECANNSSGKCQGSGVYRILPQELEFYRKMNLPLPRLCPACRHQERIKQRNPMKLYKRRCMCGGETSTNGVYKNTAKHFHNQDRCPNEFYTTYPPESPEIVYCDECYKREVE